MTRQLLMFVRRELRPSGRLLFCLQGLLQFVPNFCRLRRAPHLTRTNLYLLDMPHDGIFPPLDNEALRCPSEGTLMDGFCNYKGVEEEEGHVESEITRYLDTGYLRSFDIAADLGSFVDGAPVCITRLASSRRLGTVSPNIA